MPENTLTGRVLEALVSAGLLTSEQLGSATEGVAGDGRDPGTALLERGLVTEDDVRGVLEEELGIPQVDLSSYAPEDSALAHVPASVAKARRILPLFEIEGILTVAVGEPADVFKLDAVAAEVGVELEPVLADPASVLGAIATYYASGEREAEAPSAAVEAPEDELFFAPEDVFEVAEAPFVERPAGMDVIPPAPIAEVPVDAGTDPAAGDERESEHAAGPVPAAEPEVGLEGGEAMEAVAVAEAPAGTPSVDLDVLAVADQGKVAVLVSDILDQAARRGATRIHLLPYKDDFFLVFRVGGRLEKVASAPLSMQNPLVDGFKSFARLSSVPPDRPALGRLRVRLADKDLVATVSTVPTVAGQRMVIGLAPVRPIPRTLPELGMSQAEARALHAMVERGRGLLLVCAPVGGGASSTYYALLAHAAQAGKTVYSVERGIEYELPAVAQVLVNPGSPVGAASYFAAGMRQDTDVIAIDALQSVEEVHLAIEAAGMGKLVIGTFTAGGIVEGVWRMLGLGAESNSLAAALTLGIGQRLVRTNCPACSRTEDGDLAARIPGAPTGLVSKAGAGCDACARTGFGGTAGIFEILPFTESVRAAVARGASYDCIAGAASSAGMRSLMAAGLEKVEEGLVSAGELDRVLRYS